MAKRTLGWVQNPGDLNKLKRVVCSFVAGSEKNIWLREERLPLLKKYGLISEADYTGFVQSMEQELIELPYGILKGRGNGGGKRSEALCSGIVQAVLEGQQSKEYTDDSGKTIEIKKPYTDDWSADGYLRWAISCGLLDYDNEKDTCRISDLGKRLAASEDESQEEKEVFSIALLSYPPVIRILSLLSENEAMTKFELGSQLGFKGELGFTSIPQGAYMCDINEAESSVERKNIRNNEEGDSDKYARGIANWLEKMGWVEQATKEVTDEYRGRKYTEALTVYSITRKGEKALIRARGNSSNARIERVVLFEMLASNKALGANYLRYERACILDALKSRERTLAQLKTELGSRGIDISESGINDHINGLISIGIDIENRDYVFKLKDKIVKLEIPENAENTKEEIIDIKERIREKLDTLNHKYLILVDLAYSDASSVSKKNADAREFEIQTAELFSKELNFKGRRLGDANRPDVIIYYGANGTIIDNKSYKDGFSIDRHCADEMGRYVNENIQRIDGVPTNEWWKEFDKSVSKYTFLFITSFLKGRFEEQLEYISTTHDGIRGGAIGVESLLYLAENIKSGRKTYESFFEDFNNKEMIYDAL